MNKSLRAAIRSLPLALGLWTAPLCTHAALLAYEGFDYTANTSIAAQAGGTGWTNVWASGGGPGLATNIAGSLGYTDVNGRSLQTSGGSLVIGNPFGTTATTATPNRAINGNLSGGTNTTAGPGRTNWISFLYQRLNFIPGPFFRQANLGLFEGGTERGAVGAPNTSATNLHLLSVWGSGAHNSIAAFQAPGFPITGGSTYFILMRIITDGATNNDACHVWFNWTNLLVEPDISTATLTNTEVNLSAVNILRLQAGNANASGSNAVWQADELRLGTTFADVTPNVASNLINSGTLRLTGSAAFTVGGSFTNTGTLDVMTWSGTLPGGFVNNGTLLTRNAIQITSAGASGTNFNVTITGYTGHNYQLEYRNALGIAPWVSVGTPVAGIGAPVVLTHPGGSTAQQRFYRVAVNP